MLIKESNLSFPRNLAHVTFDELLIVFSIKVIRVNLLYLFYCFKVLSSGSDKTKLSVENLLITLILMTQVLFYLLSFLNLIRNSIIFL